MYNDHASVASLRQVDGMLGTRGRFHRSTHKQTSCSQSGEGKEDFPNGLVLLAAIREAVDEGENG